MNDTEYKIPEEPMSYWLEHFEDWLGRVAIDLDGRHSPVLQTLHQQVMTRLDEVAFLKEREMKREKLLRSISITQKILSGTDLIHPDPDEIKRAREAMGAPPSTRSFT